MFLSLFYSDIHLLLKTLVLRKYNTGISIEAKINWRSFLNPIVSVWSENVLWRVAVYRKLTNKGWPSSQLMVRQMRKVVFLTIWWEHFLLPVSNTIITAIIMITAIIIIRIMVIMMMMMMMIMKMILISIISMMISMIAIIWVISIILIIPSQYPLLKSSSLKPLRQEQFLSVWPFAAQHLCKCDFCLIPLISSFES